MDTFYARFIQLCNEAGKTPSAVATDTGIAKSAVTKWKKGTGPTDANIYKLAEYFNVDPDWLKSGLNTKEKDPATGGEVSEDDLKFALFGGEATDKQLDEVRRFAQFIKERDAK